MGEDGRDGCGQFEVDVSEDLLGCKISSPARRTHGCSGPLQTAKGYPRRRSTGCLTRRFGNSRPFRSAKMPPVRLEQIFPVPTPAQLKECMSAFTTSEESAGRSTTTLREWFFCSPALSSVDSARRRYFLSHPAGPGRLLDIGCNEGRTLKNYARNGFQAEGAETERNRSGGRPFRRVHGFTGPLDDFVLVTPFDVVCCPMSLEHALDPKAM